MNCDMYNNVCAETNIMVGHRTKSVQKPCV